MADQAFVNSSIQRNVANRVTPTADGQTPWASRAAILNATAFYHGGEAYTPTDHDYATIGADESAPAPYTGGQTIVEFDGAAWSYAYGVNERPFTAAENAALASGVTAEGLADIKKTLSGKLDKDLPLDDSGQEDIYVYSSNEDVGSLFFKKLASTFASAGSLVIRALTGDIAVPAAAGDGDYAIGKKEAKATFAAKPARIALPDVPVGTNLRGGRIVFEFGSFAYSRSSQAMPVGQQFIATDGNVLLQFRASDASEIAAAIPWKTPYYFNGKHPHPIFFPGFFDSSLTDEITAMTIGPIFIPDDRNIVVQQNTLTRFMGARASNIYNDWDWGFVWFEPKQ